MSEFEIPIGSLEEQAFKRKERLKNLKRKAQEKDTESSEGTATQTRALPSPLTAKNGAETAKESDDSAASEAMEVDLKNDDVISKITSEVDELRKPIIIEEIDIQNLAPRKPDWDLKRDVAKKLDTLERRTQRAIAELIRERLQSNEGNIDLQAVNAVGYTAQPSKS